MKYLILSLLLLTCLRSYSQSCTGASAISASGTDHNSTTINFTANEDVLNYVIVYYIVSPVGAARQNINDPGPAYPHVTSGPLGSLTPSSTYSYYIVTKCNAGDSVISATSSFSTTAAPCNAVTGLTVSPLTSTTAYVFATPYTYATSYTLKYVKQGQIDTVTVGPSVNPTWQLSNLLPNTTYAYRIQSTCPVGTNSASSTFTTSQQPTKYTPMLNNGYEYKRAEFDSTIGIPTGQIPSLRGGKDSSFALFYDSVRKVLYGYDPPTQTWNSVTGCTTTFDTYSDSTGGPVTGETVWTPALDGVDLLPDRQVLVLIRNSIPLTQDVDYTYNQETGTITFTDIVLAEETFQLTYSCGPSGATTPEDVSYIPYNMDGISPFVWDYSAHSNIFDTITTNKTLIITNAVAGKYGSMTITQGAGGNHSVILPAGSIIINGQGAGTFPVLSTAFGDTDILVFYYNGINYFWTIGKDYQ